MFMAKRATATALCMGASASALKVNQQVPPGLTKMPSAWLLNMEAGMPVAERDTQIGTDHTRNSWAGLDAMGRNWWGAVQAAVSRPESPMSEDTANIDDLLEGGEAGSAVSLVAQPVPKASAVEQAVACVSGAAHCTAEKARKLAESTSTAVNAARNGVADQLEMKYDISEQHAASIRPAVRPLSPAEQADNAWMKWAKETV